MPSVPWQQGHPGARESEARAGLWAAGRHVDTTGAAGSNRRLVDDIQPLGTFLLGHPAGKLLPLGHALRSGPTWHLMRQGRFPVASGSLLISDRECAQHHEESGLGV